MNILIKILITLTALIAAGAAGGIMLLMVHEFVWYVGVLKFYKIHSNLSHINRTKTKSREEIDRLSISKGGKKMKTKNEIKKWLDSMGIENYKINKDLTVDVDGDVYIMEHGLTEIPIKFGKVSGSFDCSNNNLESLEGAPEKVGLDFYCDYNKLKSLKGVPEHIDGSFDCSNNNLKSLNGAPKYVGGYFGCNYNNLESLNDAPEYIGMVFECGDNELTSLNGAPKYVDGDFYCNFNNLTSLEGAPRRINGNFNCSYNKLKELNGAPEYVDGDFYCINNSLNREYLEKVDFSFVKGEVVTDYKRGTREM